MKTIHEMALEAGFGDADDSGVWITDGYWDKELEAFAKLVREDEREEIAQFIENTELGSLPQSTAMHYALLLKSYANAIRARLKDQK